KSHILTKKSQKRIRGFRKEAVLSAGDAAVVSQRMGAKN
ncbi:MAG: 50S ribosomal protein L35, partial [Atopobium sp.]|nr:50S ribosomal protein L35 [Atopobium sp.]